MQFGLFLCKCNMYSLIANMFKFLAPLWGFMYLKWLFCNQMYLLLWNNFTGLPCMCFLINVNDSLKHLFLSYRNNESEFSFKWKYYSDMIRIHTFIFLYMYNILILYYKLFLFTFQLHQSEKVLHWPRQVVPYWQLQTTSLQVSFNLI